ncbi:MAG: hypothetical protein ACLFR9_07290, partial [Desulfobacterales bacterium]
KLSRPAYCHYLVFRDQRRFLYRLSKTENKTRAFSNLCPPAGGNNFYIYNFPPGLSTTNLTLIEFFKRTSGRAAAATEAEKQRLR